MTWAIETGHLSRSFGAVRALDRLSLRVRKGTIHGLIGSNGAGKSTALRILATVLAPTAGWATVCGLDVERQAAEVRERIGYLPDPPGGYGDLSAEEFLLYFARLHRVKPARAAVDGVLALTGLEAVRDRLVSALSRGTRQRLGVARCLLHRPEVLILDEPASALDPQARRELLAFLEEIRRMGSTVILSSHVLPDLEALCDEVCVLDGGRSVAAGTMAELARAVGAEPRWELRVGSDPEAAGVALRAQGASGVERNGEVLTFAQAGGEDARAALMQGLLAAGVAVGGLRLLPPTLEQIYLKATERRAEPAAGGAPR